MGYKAYSDSYLMSLTKAQIIELLRIAEHNFFVTEEALNNSAKTGMEIAEKFDKSKRLLRLAIKNINDAGACETCEYYPVVDSDMCQKDNCYKWCYADEVEKLLNDKKINNVE